MSLGNRHTAASQPFEDSELDALLFFGRERDTEIVVANLIASRLTVLYGPSGVGKSSLPRAAVAREARVTLPEEPVRASSSRPWSDDPGSTRSQQALAERCRASRRRRRSSCLAEQRARPCAATST